MSPLGAPATEMESRPGPIRQNSEGVMGSCMCSYSRARLDDRRERARQSWDYLKKNLWRISQESAVTDAEKQSLVPITDAVNVARRQSSELTQDDKDQPWPLHLKAMILHKKISVLLLFLPFAWLSAKQSWNPQYVFWLNFLGMIPLASILGDFTEELALHTNQVVGGLINATFGNAVEVVVAVNALLANEIRVVQASMIGSVLSNLLLVLGCCFFFGGCLYSEQSFNSTAATANMSLLALSSIGLVLPTPFAEYYNVQNEEVLMVSRIAAIFLMFMYFQLLFFQLKTHVDIFTCEEDDEEASIPFWVAMTGLVIVTALVAIFSDYLVDSIDGYVEQSNISKTFVGIIILPIVGNAVEHITAVTVATKNKMDLSMGVAIGSSVQVSLFVVPFIVLVGWIADKPMTLNFPHFEIILYILSVITVHFTVANGKTN